MRGAVDGAAHPSAARARAPSGDDLGKARLLALLRAKTLDHCVAAHRIGQRAAQTRVPCVGKSRCRRDIAKRQHCRHHDEQHRTRGDDSTHQRPEPAEQQRRADEHDDRRQQRDQDRVVEQVERPHAARYLAHRRSGEAVGVPVGGKALDAMEGVGGDIRHHLQRQFDDGHEGEVAQHDTGKRQRHQHGKGRHRRIPRDLVGGSTAGNGIDQPAGIERRQHVGQGRQQERGHDERKPPWLAPPMTEREAKDDAKSARAQIYLKTSHDVIRAQASPVLVRSKIEKTALGQIAPRNAEVRHSGGSPEYGRRPASTNTCCQTGLPMKVKTFRAPTET